MLVKSGKWGGDFELNELYGVVLGDFAKAEHKKEAAETLAAPLGMDHAPEEPGLWTVIRVLIAATAEEPGFVLEDEESGWGIVEKGCEGLAGVSWLKRGRACIVDFETGLPV